MSKHTPTPWSGHDLDIQNDAGEIVASTWIDPVCESDAKANAEFIVRAVNNHEALVEALTTLMNEIDDQLLQHRFSGVIGRANRVLKQSAE